MSRYVKRSSGITENQKAKLKALLEKGCTDSDIEDFCAENNVSLKEAYRYTGELSAPKECKGCKYIYFFRGAYPCIGCSRAPHKDMYETEED